ncbi:MAG: hypothetical protein HY671_14965 [Chloroflexi bacterium]|nr:hypothetical protein [Chloroflexota bacterium]
MKIKHKTLISSLSALVMLAAMAVVFTPEPVRATHADSAIQVIRYQEGNTDFAKVTFEGAVDSHAIRSIDVGFVILNLRSGGGRPVPASNYDWWALIDKDAGGTGNFANEPSPSTVAFTRDTEAMGIGFSQAVSGVMLYYASFVPVELVAYDINNTIIASASGRANWNLGQGDPDGQYNLWEPIKVEMGPNIITSVWLFGEGNRMAVDDLLVSRKRPITDSTPPVITPIISGNQGNNGWYNATVTVSWTVADPQSPISSSSGCGPSSVTYDTGGVTFTCTAASAGGTNSKSVTIKRDATPPSVAASRSPGPNHAGWNNSDVTVSFSASDALSGVAGCTAPVILSTEGAGQSASGACTDGAGNSASTSVGGINIDKTPPYSVASLSGTMGGNGWYVSNVQVTLGAGDKTGGTGASKIEYSLDGVNLNTYTGPFTIASEGATTVYYRAWDYAGNVESTRTTTFKIDKTPATSSVTLAGTQGANGWYASDVQVTISSSDKMGGSGVSKIEYSLDGVNLKTYAGPFPVSTEGTTTVYYRSWDAAGNVEATRTVTFKIDKTPPTAAASVSPGPNTAGWNNTSVVVSFSGTDSLSGIASCTAPVTLSTEGAGQSATGACTDKAGNVSAPAAVTGINIDLTKPTVVFATLTPAPNAAGWNNADVTTGYTVNDNLSGVASSSPSSPLSFTAEGAGLTQTVTAVDKAGNSATFTSPAVNLDKTKPAVAFGPITPTPSANGWNNADVTVAYTVSDSLSGVASPNPATPLSFSTEGAGLTQSVTVVDKAGNSATFASPAVNLDRTKPMANASASPGPNASGWNNTSVVVSFSGSDSVSGIALCSPPATLSTEGAGQSATGTCTDKAGNVSAPATSSGINIDLTKPEIAVASPEPKDYLTSESLTLNFSIKDPLSGLAIQSATLDGSPVSSGQVINLANRAGNHTVLLSATDKSGNSHSVTVAFTVVIAATVDVKPDTLNVRGQSDNNAVTAYIEFPSGYDVTQISVATVKLKAANGAISAQMSPTSLGDYDADGVADRMVKFDRQAVIAALTGQTGNFSLAVSGQLSDGRRFAGGDVISVINPGK